MSRHEEWTTEPRERGWLSRMIAPQGSGQPGTAAFLIGALAAAAFVASLTLDWLSVSTLQPADSSSQSGPPQSQADNIVNVFFLGLVYTIGGVAQLGLVGAVITQSETALRLRMGAAGLSVGLLGVVLAAMIRLPEDLSGQLGGFETGAQATVSYEPGLLCAYAAAVLPAAAIWLAARPAARAARAREDAERAARTRQAAEEPDVDPVPSPRRSRNDRAHGLSVSPAEPIDLTVTPDGGAR